MHHVWYLEPDYAHFEQLYLKYLHHSYDVDHVYHVDGVTSGTGTVYPSEEHTFIPGLMRFVLLDL